MDAHVIAHIIQEKVHNNPSIRPHDIKADFQTSHGFKLSYMKAWRGVEVARANIFGSYYDSFVELRWYSEAITKKNPGSVVTLDVDNEIKQFKRFFFAFKGCLEGFKSCRPMLFIDGTFMHNRYKERCLQLRQRTETMVTNTILF